MMATDHGEAGMRRILNVLIGASILLLAASGVRAGVGGSLICTAAAPNGTLYNNQGTVTQPFFLAVSVSPACSGTPTGTFRIGIGNTSHVFAIADGSAEGFQFAIAPASTLIYSCAGSAGTCGMKVEWSLESTH
jgi:hypothetical protein